MTAVALLADVHGNLAALEAVLAEPEVRACDEVVFLGDAVMNGPRPAGCLALLMELGLPAVIGNTDLEVLAGADPVAAWARERLSPEGLLFLARLPLTFRPAWEGPGSAQAEGDARDLLLMHASPRSPFDLPILEPHPLGTTFTRASADGELRAMFRGHCAGLSVFGHIHYASWRRLGGQALASVGSVGFPFDGDRRAAYGVVTWRGGGWTLDHRRVSYDSEAVAREVEASGLPFASRSAAMLRQARWLPRPG
ncbi:metallophosphoesterase [Deinococcus aetherius]|uniref:Metallophosphoesterase n=1 Tax=Deinococcus aetherius TaxID=200252 RepID=A0ABN6REH2_9DEIO|nr:metallophosphoesterase family protein [Deinococcus aetherius]BDP40274.1 metallophosphoesterase [Deinococcus aetherius]